MGIIDRLFKKEPAIEKVSYKVWPDALQLCHSFASVGALNPCYAYVTASKRHVTEALAKTRCLESAINRIFEPGSITHEKFCSEVGFALEKLVSNVQAITRYAIDAQPALIEKTKALAAQMRSEDEELAEYYRSHSPVDGNSNKWSAGLSASHRLAGVGGYSHKYAARDKLADIPYLKDMVEEDEQIVGKLSKLCSTLFQKENATQQAKTMALIEDMSELISQGRFYRGIKDFDSNHTENDWYQPGTLAMQKTRRQLRDAAVCCKIGGGVLDDASKHLARGWDAVQRIRKLSGVRFSGSTITSDKFTSPAEPFLDAMISEAQLALHYAESVPDASVCCLRIKQLADTLDQLIMEIDAPGTKFSEDGYEHVSSDAAERLDILIEDVPKYC